MRKILVILILTSFLSACDDNAPKEWVDFQYSWNAKDQKCEKRLYRVASDRVAPLENFQLVDVSECDLLIGYKPKPYSRLWAFLEYVRSQIASQGFIDDQEFFKEEY